MAEPLKIYHLSGSPSGLVATIARLNGTWTCLDPSWRRRILGAKHLGPNPSRSLSPSRWNPLLFQPYSDHIWYFSSPHSFSLIHSCVFCFYSFFQIFYVFFSPVAFISCLSSHRVPFPIHSNASIALMYFFLSHTCMFSMELLLEITCFFLF